MKNVNIIQVFPYLNTKLGCEVRIKVHGLPAVRKVVPKKIYEHIKNEADIRAKLIDWGEKEAVQSLEKRASKAQEKAQRLIQGKGLTLNEFAPQYFKHVEAKLSAQTLLSYSRNYRLHIKPHAIGDTSLSDIRYAHIEELFKDVSLKLASKSGRPETTGDGVSANPKPKKQLGAKSVNGIMTVISGLLNYAHKKELINSVPAIEKRRVSDHAQKKLENYEWYNDAQLDVLINCASQLHPMLVSALLLGADAGCRLSEICGLAWSSIDFENNTINIVRQLLRDGTFAAPKYGSFRKINMTNRLRDTLSYLHTNHKEGVCVINRVLLDEKSGRGLHSIGGVSTGVLHHWLQTITSRANPIDSSIPADSSHWHKLRHSFCTRVALATNDPFEVKKLAGHKDIKTSMRYCHSSNGGGIDGLNNRAKALDTKGFNKQKLRLVK